MILLTNITFGIFQPKPAQFDLICQSNMANVYFDIDLPLIDQQEYP